MRRRDPEGLTEAAVAGDRVALARLLTLVEEGGEAAREVARRTWPLGGAAYTVGITGAPGAGKSTLTGALLHTVRRSGDPVAVLAVDPSSPFSGGAILGDRVRMNEHALDPGVFIRSMATRGRLGGLSLAVPEAVRTLDAAGFPWVLVETVGVGQVEVDIAAAADTTVVVVNPGWGDAVQAAKAGLMEIADVFVVNKADRPGAADTEHDLLSMLELGGRDRSWRPPVVRTIAATGDGVDALWDAVRAHRAHLERDDAMAQRRAHRLDGELRETVLRLLEQEADDRCRGPLYDEVRAAVLARTLDPHAAALRLVGR